MKPENQTLQVVNSNSKYLHYGTRILVVLIAIGAGLLSFDGLAQLATAAGVKEELSYIWAIVIDGFILVATFAAFALQDRTDGDRIKKYYAWAVLAIFVIISIFGNALHALPAEDGYELPMWVKISVNAVPPIALFLAIHLIIIMISPTSAEKQDIEVEKKRKERENRMAERKLAAAERLNEREAQAIEKAPVNPVISTTPVVMTPQTIGAEPSPILKTVSQKPEQLTIEALTEEISHDTEYITKDEALQKLIDMINTGEELPSGRTVGGWMGLKISAGQNLVRLAKAKADESSESTE